MCLVRPVLLSSYLSLLCCFSWTNKWMDTDKNITIFQQTATDYTSNVCHDVDKIIQDSARLQVCNSLPYSCQSTKTVTTFKRALKTELLATRPSFPLHAPPIRPWLLALYKCALIWFDLICTTLRPTWCVLVSDVECCRRVDHPSGVNLRVFWTSTSDQKFPTSCRMYRTDE